MVRQNRYSMTNESMDTDFLGKFLQTIVEDYVPELHIDAGTILIQDVDSLQVFFQVETDYVYRRSGRFSFFKNGPMSILPGSAIDNYGKHLPDSSKFVIAQRVRIPSTYELEWYYKQNTV